MDANVLTKAYDDVIDATEKAIRAGIEYDTQKEALENVTAIGLSKGVIIGKNDAERKASSLVMYDTMHKSTAAAEEKYRELKLVLDLAKLHLDCLRDILRIEELAATSK